MAFQSSFFFLAKFHLHLLMPFPTPKCKNSNHSHLQTLLPLQESGVSCKHFNTKLLWLEAEANKNLFKISLFVILTR